MAILTMLVGLPASGKSTLGAKLVELQENTILLSSDSIREELFGKRSEENNPLVFDTLHKKIHEQLKLGVNVVYDATNINSKRRKGFLLSLPKDVYKKCIFKLCTPSLCVLRNKKRENSVPEEVIARMYKNFQIPMKHEGWDEIEVIQESNCETKSKLGKGIEPLEKVKMPYNIFCMYLKTLGVNTDLHDFCQDNPHHTFSVLKHSYYVYEFLFDNYQGEDKDVLLFAAMLHDLGKVQCKAYKEGSRYATYYGHENVSSQFAMRVLMNNSFDTSVVHKVSTIIQLHMRLSYDGNTKGDEKLLKMVGDSLYNQLVIFREADSNAK